MEDYDNNSRKGRSFKHFTSDDREKIREGLEAGKTLAAIANSLEVKKSVAAVSYEIKRGTKKGTYKELRAQKEADKRKKNSHQHTKWKNTGLLHYLERHLQKRQSPEVIAHFYNLKHKTAPSRYQRFIT